jgi:predicted metal-dependent phosphotriesterase family hydrolase
MAVMTVTGPVEAEGRGVVLPHEHLISAGRAYDAPPSDPALRAISDGPVVMEHLGLMRRDLFAIRNDLVLDHIDTADDWDVHHLLVENPRRWLVG